MFTLTVLGSSSSGNSSLVRTDNATLLVDAGFSCRELTKRLAAAGCAPEDLEGIIITHEHSDHTRGLEVMCRKYFTRGIPVYTNPFTAEVLMSSSDDLAQTANFQYFQTGNGFEINDLRVETFPVPHDAVDPVGLVFANEGERIGFLTDLGHPTRAVIDRIKTVHTLVIETNYDRALLLADNRRPWSTKQRIMNRHGHLSNDAACEVLSALMPLTRLQRLVLSHLSMDCNTPELARQTVRERLELLQATHIEVHCASPTAVSPVFIVGEHLFSTSLVA